MGAVRLSCGGPRYLKRAWAEAEAQPERCGATLIGALPRQNALYGCIAETYYSFG